MNIKKELLLVVATTLVSAGTLVITTDIVRGTAILLLGAAVFIGRGLYKKYLEKSE